DEGLPSAFIAFGSQRLFGVHYLVWVPVVLLAVLSYIMHSTPYGRRVYATGGGREAAYLSGVPVRRVIASTYIWCGALAGLAGAMLAARLQSGQPTAGEFYELTAIAAVVLGGASLHGGEGTPGKSVIGVFIMVVLGNALNLLNVDSYWQRVAVGVVIIAAAAADRLRSRELKEKPDGLLTPRHRCRRRHSHRGRLVSGARTRSRAEDEHRRGARPGRQPALHFDAARHPCARPGARLGRRRGFLQRGQAQTDQRRAGPDRPRRQRRADLADRRGRCECGLRRGGSSENPDYLARARFRFAQPDPARRDQRKADRRRDRRVDGKTHRRRGQGRHDPRPERRARVPQSRRRLHRRDGEASRDQDRVPHRRRAHPRTWGQTCGRRARRQSRPQSNL